MTVLTGCATENTKEVSQLLKVATFNASMEATNYAKQGQLVKGNELSKHLHNGQHLQIQNIAEIIQRLRPDIVLLNEFDYSNQSATDAQNFIMHYLKKSQNNNEPIDYPYFYTAPVNTGVDSGG
jgi:prophage tail gpP-like protein